MSVSIMLCPKEGGVGHRLRREAGAGVLQLEIVAAERMFVKHANWVLASLDRDSTKRINLKLFLLEYPLD